MDGDVGSGRSVAVSACQPEDVPEVNAILDEAQEAAAWSEESLAEAASRANRRAGVATSLVTALMRIYSQRGVRKIFLEVRESNEGAIAFYEGLGFRQVGRRPDYYREPGEAALILAREVCGEG